MLPCDYPVGGWYGYDPSYPGNSARIHYGLDFLAPAGTPLRAPCDCTILSLARGPVGVIGCLNDGWGLYARMQLPDGRVLDYCHLSAFSAVAVGQRVQAGDVVGYSGETGIAGVTVFGPHLHVQMWPNLAATTDGSNRIDPAALWLRLRG